MSRLFITPREIDFINDISKEIISDVIGQKVYFFSISLTKSRVHDVYDEAPDKIFDNPVELDCLVANLPSEPRATAFGIETYKRLEVYIQSRTLIDKNLEIVEGDFVSYGTQFFEIHSILSMRDLYGQVEYKDGLKLICQESRKGQFATKILGPKGEEYSDADAVQKTFVQKRGQEEGDVRSLQNRGVLDPPLTNVKEVSEKGAGEHGSGTSSFYDES